MSITASSDLGVLKSSVDDEVFSLSATRTIVLPDKLPNILREDRMPGIAAGQKGQKLNQPLAARSHWAKVPWISDDDIGVDGSMKVTFLAFHEDGAGLFRHAIVIVYPSDAT
jgi:hypothetical protein